MNLPIENDGEDVPSEKSHDRIMREIAKRIIAMSVDSIKEDLEKNDSPRRQD